MKWQLQGFYFFYYTDFTNCMLQLKRNTEESWPRYSFFCMTINLLTGQAALLESRFEEVHHPPYFPDGAPSAYHLFPDLKKHLCGLRFLTDDELKYVSSWRKSQNFSILQALKNS